jgi:hypothetical protein
MQTLESSSADLLLPESELRRLALEQAPIYYTDSPLLENPADAYPYHNFYGHVTQTFRDFTHIYHWLEDKGITLNYDLGIIALAYHDANFHLNEKAAGFETKEAYSAHIAGVDLQQFGANRYEVRTVKSAIIATTASESPKTNLEKAVRLADVGNVSGDPTTFLHNTYLLITESIKRGLSLPETFEVFRENSQGFLNMYYKNPIEFTQNGRTVTYEPIKDGQKNIQRLGKISLIEFIDIVHKVEPTAKSTLSKIWQIK